jgi:replicative DNA helicase
MSPQSLKQQIIQTAIVGALKMDLPNTANRMLSIKSLVSASGMGTKEMNAHDLDEARLKIEDLMKRI